MRDGLKLFANRRWPDADIRWMSLPRISVRQLGQLRTLVSELRGADAVVLAGGTHFHDDYGLRSMRILLSHLAVFLAARASGAAVGYVGIGVGPLRSRLARGLVKPVLAVADAVLVRDRASWELVRRISPRTNVIRGFDSAVLLTPPPRTQNRGNHVIGISILPYFGLHERTPERDDQMVATLSSAIRRRHAEDPSLVVRVLVFFQGHRDSDLPISRRLVDTLAPDVPAVLEECSDPDETLAAVAGLDALIATRYHAAMFGYLVGCPTLVVSYQDKCAALAEEIGLPKDAVWQPSDLLDEERVVQALRALKDEPDRFSAAVPVAQQADLTRTGLDAFSRALAPCSPNGSRV